MVSDYKQITEDNVRKRGEDFDDIGHFIAEQLYSDRTHFIYELLQNADDALDRRVECDPGNRLPKSITFRLYSDRLEVSHFGQPFNEDNVKAISDVLRGTKKDNGNQIGTFGIGFKSVYAFTASPEIYSGEEHFCIQRYIRPCKIEPQPLLEGETLFIFRFNHQSELPQDTFRRISNRLKSFSPHTLLFLRHIEEISWNVENGLMVTYRREIQRIAPNCRRVAVIGKSREEWLVFDKPVESKVKPELDIKVEIAFLLSKEKQSGKEQVVPVKGSSLVVFLPTEVETDLQFLVQGPYCTTSARDNILRDDSFNQELIEHTAALVAEVLPQIHKMGLLTVSFLNVLPIRKSDFEKNPLFRPVFEKVRQTFKEKELLPPHDGDHVAATQAMLARSKDFRELLSENQLQQLYGNTYRWLSDEITQGRSPDIHKYITEELGVREIEPEHFARNFTESFIEQQTDGWVARFYAFLDKQEALWRSDGILRKKPFIRLQDGSHVTPFRSDGLPNAYIPSLSDERTEFPTVKQGILENKLVGKEATRFLIHLGFSHPDIFDEVMGKIIPKYEHNKGVKIDDYEHEHDIKKILQALKQVFLSPVSKNNKISVPNKGEQLINKLKATSFISALNAGTGERAYKRPEELYFRSPDLEEIYFKGNPEIWFLHEDSTEKEYFARLGVSDKVRIFCKKPGSDGHIIILKSARKHQRGLNGFDPTCKIDGLQYALSNPTYGKALYIWNNLLYPNFQHICGKVEESSNKEFKNPESPIFKYSEMGRMVATMPWLPDRDKNDKPYKPNELSIDDLPDDFIKTQNIAKRLKMNYQSIAVVGDELTQKLTEKYKPVLKGKSVTQEYLDFVLINKEQIENNKELILGSDKNDDKDSDLNSTTETIEPIDLRQALRLTFSRSGSNQTEFNDILPNQLVNPELYKKRVSEETSRNQSQEIPAERRFKKVLRKIWEPKDSRVRTFLKNEYEGKCQICGCKAFTKQKDNEPYFEGLYLVSYTRKSWLDDAGIVLSLCANCCAKFIHGSVEVAEDIVVQINREVDKANPVLHIKICGKDEKIQYTKKHIIRCHALLNFSDSENQQLQNSLEN